jgi:hypothetical protein
MIEAPDGIVHEVDEDNTFCLEYWYIQAATPHVRQGWTLPTAKVATCLLCIARKSKWSD